MNTQFEYMYRDGDNYKTFGTVVLSGTLTSAEKEEIINTLDESEYFIPSQVGLENIQECVTEQTDPNPEFDHIWHELVEEDITETQQNPTIKMTARELLQRFRTVKWDVDAAMKELGL